MKGSVLRISFLSNFSEVSTSTVAANLVSKSETSKVVIGLTPMARLYYSMKNLRCFNWRQRPRPVTTTLLFDIGLMAKIYELLFI